MAIPFQRESHHSFSGSWRILSFAITVFIAAFLLAGNVYGLSDKWVFEKTAATSGAPKVWENPEDIEFRVEAIRENPKARYTRFVWEGMRLLQEIGPAPDAEGKIRQNGNVRVRSWIYEPDGTGYVPLAAMDQALGKHGVGKARIHYIHTDHLGTPQEVTDGEGRIEWSADYSAWGERQHSLVLNSEEEAERRTDCAIRFQGQYFDAETGLHYNTFRYYDPGCGRFISPDPINIQGGLNLYQYAPNAANWIDPWGWSCFFRGSKNGKPVSFKAKPGEYRIDSKTGLVKDTHGVSVFDNPQSVTSQGFDPHKVDMSTVSDDLKIIQRGNDPHHYEIVPSKPMSLESYQEALSKIKVFG